MVDDRMVQKYVEHARREGGEFLLRLLNSNQREIRENAVKAMGILKGATIDCPKCGTVGPFDSSFCEQCGTVIPEDLRLREAIRITAPDDKAKIAASATHLAKKMPGEPTLPGEKLSWWRSATHLAQKVPGEGDTQIMDFFSFRAMVSSLLIKIIYVIGVLVITLGGAFYFWKMGGTIGEFDGKPLLAFIGFIIYFLLANLLWRLICEGIIIVFSIHERLTSIEKLLKGPK